MMSFPATGGPGTVAVVGAGAIGLSWTSLFLAHGYEVWVTDPRPDLAEAVGTALAEAAPVLAGLGLPSQGLERHLHVAGNLAKAVAAADFVQENGPERVDVKRSLFTDILAAAPPHCIVLSSSSAIPVTTSAAGVADADRIVIGHPFNPPLVMPLVEVVPGEQTSAATTKAATDFYVSVGKLPIVVGKELPGFVANRLQNALVREAFSLVLDGVVTPAELDAVVTRSLGLRWAAAGPFLALRLGGGPGGFSHLAAHIGPEMARMWATLGNPNPDPETFQHVGELVDGAYSDSPIPEQAAQRDERQIAILQSLARFDHSAEHPCPDSRHHTAPESRVATPVKPLKARTHKPHPALPGRLTTYGEAMPRIEIPDAAAIGDLPPALEQVERSGALINVFRVMLRSPQIASAVLSLGAAQFGTSSLASVDRELAILAAGSTFQAPYEAAQHAPISTAVGVSDAQRAAIAEGRWDSAEFSAPQQALLRFVADVATSPTVTDEVFAAVLAHYSQQQIVDVVVQTGYYFLIGRVTTVLDVPLDPPTDARVLDVGLSMTSKKK